MTTNTNIETQLQARLNAVTAGTSDTDMLKLAKAAEGYTVDRTVFDAELQSRITALGAGNTNTELLKVAKTVALPAAGSATDTSAIRIQNMTMRQGYGATKNTRIHLDGAGNVVNTDDPVEQVATTGSHITQYGSPIAAVLEANHYDKLYAYPRDATTTRWYDSQLPSDADSSVCTDHKGAGNIYSTIIHTATYDNVLHQHTMTCTINGVPITIVSQSPPEYDTYDQATVTTSTSYTYVTPTYSSFHYAGRTYFHINTLWQLSTLSNKQVQTSNLVSIIDDQPGSERVTLMCPPLLVYLGTAQYMGYTSNNYSAMSKPYYSPSKGKIFIPNTLLRPSDNATYSDIAFYTSVGTLIIDPTDDSITHTHASQDDYANVRCVLDGDVYTGTYPNAAEFQGYVVSAVTYYQTETINLGMSDVFKVTSTGNEYIEGFANSYLGNTTAQRRRLLFQINRTLKTLTLVATSSINDSYATNYYNTASTVDFYIPTIFDATANILYTPSSYTGSAPPVAWQLTPGTLHSITSGSSNAVSLASAVFTDVSGNVLTGTMTLGGAAQSVAYDFSAVAGKWQVTDGTLTAHASYTIMGFSTTGYDLGLGDGYFYVLGYIKGRFAGSSSNYEYRSASAIFRYQVGVVNSLEVYAVGPVFTYTGTPGSGPLYAVGNLIINVTASHMPSEHYLNVDTVNDGVPDTALSANAMNDYTDQSYSMLVHDKTTDTTTITWPAKCHISAAGTIEARSIFSTNMSSPFARTSHWHFFDNPSHSAGNVKIIGGGSPTYTDMAACAVGNYSDRCLALTARFVIGEDADYWYFSQTFWAGYDIYKMSKVNGLTTLAASLEAASSSIISELPVAITLSNYVDPTYNYTPSNSFALPASNNYLHNTYTPWVFKLGDYYASIAYGTSGSAYSSTKDYTYNITIWDSAGNWLGVILNPWLNLLALNSTTNLVRSFFSFDGRTVNGYPLLAYIENELKYFPITSKVGRVITDSDTLGNVVVAIDDPGYSVENTPGAALSSQYVTDANRLYPLVIDTTAKEVSDYVSTQRTYLNTSSGIGIAVAVTLARPVADVSKVEVTEIYNSRRGTDAFSYLLTNTQLFITRLTGTTTGTQLIHILKEYA